MPNSTDPLIMLTQNYLNARQLKKADTTLRRLKLLDQPSVQQFAISLQVELHVLREEIEEAQTLFDSTLKYAKRNDNISPGLWWHLGKSSVLLGDIEQAAQLFYRAHNEGAAGSAYLRLYMSSRVSTIANSHGAELLAHPDIQILLEKINMDDEYLAALKESH